jgi:hypothetical protein
MINPMRLQMLHQDDIIDRRTLDRMMDELEPGLSRRLRIALLAAGFGVVLLGVLIVALWFFNSSGRSGMSQAFTRNPGMWIGVLAGAIVPWLAVRKKHHHRLPGLLLKHRRCPHCGYDLSGLLEDGNDGATTCPECACAWRLTDAANAAADAASAQEPSTAVKIGLVLLLLLGMAAFGGMLLLRQGGGVNWRAVGLMGGGVAVVLGLVTAVILIVRRAK